MVDWLIRVKIYHRGCGTLSMVRSALLLIVLMVTVSFATTDHLSEGITLSDEHGSEVSGRTSTPLNIPGFVEDSIHTSTTLSAGGDHTCAVLDDGTTACWGSNSQGDLGDGTTTNRYAPTTVSSFGSGRVATSVSAGGLHTCAVLDDGRISCWGWGEYGQVGTGTTAETNPPRETDSLGSNRSAVLVSAGIYHTCAILDDGSVSCWGANNNGQLGDGTQDRRLSPTPIIDMWGGERAVALSTGGTQTCAVGEHGKVLCWGRYYGEWPSDRTGTFDPNLKVVSVAAGRMHECFLLIDGSVVCAGAGTLGQLGNGALADNHLGDPGQTQGFGQGRYATAITAGQDHTCALLDNGSVACWGNNDYGQIGVGTTAGAVSIPTLTSPFGANRSAVAITAGSYHTCALLDDDDVMCWGSGGTGQLGHGGSGARLTPNMVVTLGGAKKVVLSDRDLDGDGVMNIFEGVVCEPGSYQGGGRCTAADPGHFVATRGADAQEACPPGSFQNRSGQAFCEPATAGHFVNLSAGTGQIAQTPCPSGTYNPVGGSTAEEDCIETDPGNFTDASDGVGRTEQEPCPIGTFQPLRGQASCVGADPGHIILTTRGIGQSEQTPCPAGTFQPLSGQTLCRFADIGHFVDLALGTGQTEQTPCPIGTYQARLGATGCDASEPGFFVDAELGTGQTEQTPCPAGTFQAARGQVSCDSATPGHFVDIEAGRARAAQTPCPAGTYNPDAGATSPDACREAGIGHYVNASDGPGQLEQMRCPGGTYNPEFGATDRSECRTTNAGYHSTSSEGAAPFGQVACSPGTYQPAEGQDACLLANEGHAVAGTAAVEQTPCSPGTYQPDRGQAECVLADAGHHVPEAGQNSQISCPSGTFSSLPGAITCEEAGLGSYVEDSNRTVRIECPPFTTTYIDANTTGTTATNASACWLDTDGDGLVDDDGVFNSDVDDDGDGVVDALDAFPLDPNEFEDRNGDGLGDNAHPLTLIDEVSLIVPGGAGTLSIPLIVVILAAAVVIRRRSGRDAPSDPVDVDAMFMTRTAPVMQVPAMQDAAAPSPEISGFDDGQGYEWHQAEDGRRWYRASGAGGPWFEYR